jgi:hypothetical protein
MLKSYLVQEFAVNDSSNERIFFFSKQIPQQHPTARGTFPTHLIKYQRRESLGINRNY